MWKDMDFYPLLKTWVHMQLKLLTTWAINIVKNFLIVQKKSTTDGIKTASKRVIQKTSEATGDLIGNKIDDKITSLSEKNLPKIYQIMKQKQM